MSQIPDDDLDGMKRNIDLAALVRSKGIELKKHGSKDLVGLSPFTDEKTPSFIVTPEKNLWHCMSSGKGGTVIDFVMHYDGVSFRHAAMLLKENNPRLLGGAAVKKSTKPKLAAPVTFDADDQALLDQTISYYQERLQENPVALDYLKKRGLDDVEAIKAFRIGYADRTLGLRLPNKQRKDGLAIRERLQKIGLYRETGREHFNGCLVFPIIDEDGAVTEIYGRKVQKQKSKIDHLYLPGPHRGLWNPQALKSPEVILTESVIDALTFWIHGFKNVTCIYGTEGFTDDHFEAFRKHQAKKIILGYDQDEAGGRAARRDAERLHLLGIDCYRISLPYGLDVNDYALKVTPAPKSLKVLLNSVSWMDCTEVLSTSTLAANVSCSDAELEEDFDPEEEPEDLEEAAKEKKPVLQLQQVNEDYVLDLGDRSYRIRGLHKNSSLEVLKINLRVLHNERFHLDTFDFYRAKERNHFISLAAQETGLLSDLLKRDLGKLLLELEALQEQRLKEELASKEKEVVLSDADKSEAMELLKSPKLLDRILEDFANCGIVGEATNKLTGYLAAVSRKLDKPLAIIIQSTSAAGKTSLMESVLALMPEEERIKYSAMTGQSLYYLGETNLKHKILAIVEEEGAEKASYALKLLQSEGELTIASTGKDEQGRMKTEEYHVEGPVMIFLTTTAVDIDEELLNRCLVLTVDEGKDQTGAVHTQQRSNQTLHSLAVKQVRDETLKLHQNAQRLLKSINVVNPYAPYLTFRHDRTRFRRDHVKYLTLINCIALLHQYQRPLKEQNGYSYIEATLQDIEVANQITQEVIGRSLEELSPQGKRFLKLLLEMVTNLSKARNVEPDKILFSRRQIREHTGWSEYQVRTHTNKLRDLEYLRIHGGSHGASFLYELMYDGGDLNPQNPMCLTDVSKLQDIRL
ncbi:MAG: CHC2 zinc finger domain-containing protein [Verrucomicrobiota bacterium]